MSSIQVIEFRDGRYRLNIQVFENIFESSKDNLVAMYSVNGPKRMGKSFILDYKLRYLNNEGNYEWISCVIPNTFRSRGGSKRETTGVWMWSQPFVFEKRDGTKISLFLMDTQGSFDSQSSNNDNAIVFALSALLSSVMIFNIKNQLSEDILQFLQQYVGFARLGDNDSKDEPFQKLMFLIRDWQNPAEYDFGYYDDLTSINGMNYKRDHFDISADFPQDVKSVHETIISNFKHISFYLMPHPGEEVAQSSDNRDRMTEKFRQHLYQFVPMVLKSESIVAKKIGGEYITGAQMIEFAKTWGQLFESDAVPQLKSIFITSAETQNQMVMKRSVEKYMNEMNVKMNDKNDMTENELEVLHRSIFTECCELFKGAKRLGGEQFETKYLGLLSDEMNEEYIKYQQIIKCKNDVKKAEMETEMEIKKSLEERVENEKRLRASEEEKRKVKERLENEIHNQNQRHKEDTERAAKRHEDEMRSNDRKLKEMNDTIESNEKMTQKQRVIDAKRHEEVIKANEKQINDMKEVVKKERAEREELERQRREAEKSNGILKVIGGIVGTAIGAVIGGPVGAVMGGAAGAGLSGKK